MEVACDVFLCSVDKPEDGIRSAIALAVWQRWKALPTNVVIISTNSCSPEAFMLEHREGAERLSTTPIYCHADDDCMPLGNDFLEKAVAIMESHPEYGMIAFTDHLYAKYWEKSAEYKHGDDKVYPVLSAGGIYLMRKGIVEYPESHPWFCDTTMCDAIHKKGKKVGRFKHLMFNHFGYLLSTTYPERTGITQVIDPK